MEKWWKNIAILTKFALMKEISFKLANFFNCQKCDVVLSFDDQEIYGLKFYTN